MQEPSVRALTYQRHLQANTDKILKIILMRNTEEMKLLSKK